MVANDYGSAAAADAARLAVTPLHRTGDQAQFIVRNRRESNTELDGLLAVSYTHLDVYKRQPQEGTPPFRTTAKPVLTAVNGLCCGAGMDWVTTTDIVIASDRATFFDPHVSIGLVAGREMVRVSRVLPRSIALRMALMGKHERMGADRAYELGLISEVVEHDHLLERAHEIAAIVNSNAPLAVRGTRLAIVKGLNVPLHEAEIMAETFRERVLRTEDAAEGPKAFVEKRAQMCIRDRSSSA